MEMKTYDGSCHCGAVRYRVTMEPPKKAMACNCSICSRAGWLLAFVPGAQFELVAGDGELTDYQFGRKHLHHQFCKTCGVRSFSQGADHKGNATVAVNLRCVAGVELDALEIQTFDGAKI